MTGTALMLLQQYIVEKWISCENMWDCVYTVHDREHRTRVAC